MPFIFYPKSLYLKKESRFEISTFYLSVWKSVIPKSAKHSTIASKYTKNHVFVVFNSNKLIIILENLW